MLSLLHLNRTALALCANAVLLLLILIAITTHDGKVLAGSMAFGQTPPASIAMPGGTMTVMPCQLSQYTWGCYMLDPQNQTLCVYQYLPGQELKLLAARDIQYDRKLGYFNTSPSPGDVKSMVDRTDEPERVAPTTMRSPEERYR